MNIRHKWRVLCALVLSLSIPFVKASAVGQGIKPDLICHSSDPLECYPRVFVATDDFQVIHDDQEIPAGLHIRLDISTGVKEARLYDPVSESEELEYSTVQVEPGDDPVDVTLDVHELHQELADVGSGQRESSTEKAADLYGPIKAPASFYNDKPTFDAAINAITQASLPANFDALLEELRDLTDSMYWGLQLASDANAVQAMIRCVARTTCNEQRSVLAARVLASAMRNNAPASKIMLEYSFPDGEDPSSWASSVYDAVVHVLRSQRDSAKGNHWHIGEYVSAKSFERYISLLSAILASSPQQRSRALPLIKHMAGAEHFDAQNAGKHGQWDAARERLLQLLTDHYVFEDSVSSLDRPDQHLDEQQCLMLLEWHKACEAAVVAWGRAVRSRLGAEDKGQGGASAEVLEGMAQRSEESPSIHALQESRRATQEAMQKIKLLLDARYAEARCAAPKPERPGTASPSSGKQHRIKEDL